MVTLALAILFLSLSGCATPGPNYVYATVESDSAVHALGPEQRDIPAAVAPGERVLGLAYDFNTDHLFLRIAPAQVIRVIERPSGKILREMPLPAELRTENSADRDETAALAGGGRPHPTHERAWIFLARATSFVVTLPPASCVLRRTATRL